MAADPGEISEDLSKDQLSTGLNFGHVHEKPMEISTGMEEGALESTEIVVKPTNGVLTDQVSTCPQEEVPLVSDLVPVELMEVDPLPSSETAVVPGTDENGLNQTDVQQKSLDGTASNSQDNLVSSELSEGKAPLTKSKEPPNSDVTCVEVSENATNVSMAEASGNVVYPIYVNSLQEAEEVLHRFENNTKTRFCVWRCPKDFGASTNFDLNGKRIYWHEFDIEDRMTIKSDGIPFVMMGRKVYDCQHGRDRNVALKQKMMVKRLQKEVKKRNVTTPSRKVDCPARIVFCEIIYFPDYKLVTDTKHYRTVIAKTIRQHFTDGTGDWKNTERRIYLSFPSEKDHKGHPTTMGKRSGRLSQRVDPKVSNKISQLVAIGIRSEKEMKQHLDNYIARELFPGRARPFHSNRRFYPSKGVIRINMYNAYVKKRLEVIDLESIDGCLAQWRSDHLDDKFHFRRYADVDAAQLHGARGISVEEENEEELKIKQKVAKQQFLFAHQTSFQTHLLRRYGNHVCFLDPAYRTTKYAVPMFFISVRTNVDYQTAGSVFVQDESRESLKEGLELLKSWNPDWKPKVFMLDNDADEIATVEECFPGCKVLLSDFHREQAWERWLSLSAHGMMPHRDAILVHLHGLAEAASMDEFEDAVDTLEESDVWKCNYGKGFRTWFENNWLSVKERWAWAFTVSTLTSVLTTNNTIEGQNKEFNHEQFVGQGDTPLSEMLKMLIDSILPAKRNAYFEQNSQFPVSSTKYPNLPVFFHNRPHHLADHIGECITASHDITPEDIVVNSSSGGEFLVKSCDSDIEYSVHFGNTKRLPHCECQDWSKKILPCKHFIAIMRDFKEWNWPKFSKSYRSSPYLTLDENPAEVNPNCTKVNPDCAEVNPNCADVNPNCAEVNPNCAEVNPNCTEVNRSDSDAPGDHQNSVELDLNEMQELQKPVDKSTASNCRDVLSEINNITYALHDKRSITELHDTLNELLSKLRLSVVDDDLVVVESEADVKHGKSENKKAHERKPRTCSATPPKRGKRTSESAGQGAGDIAGKSAKLDANQANIACPSNSEILEEHVLEEMNHMDLLNMDYYRPINSAAEAGTPVNTSGIQGLSENGNSTLLFNAGQSSEPHQDPTLDLTELSEKKDCDVFLTYSSTEGSFSKHEESLISRNEMVTHESINLAQSLLGDACPHLKGFQNVARGAVQAFEPVSGDFIQILHDGNLHWVCTSNVSFAGGKDPAAVAMFDSMNQGYVAKFTKQQLASFLCIQNAEMKLIMKPVQQQANTVDCGVFAIAFATSIASGLDPSKQRFDVTRMRTHLVECLKSKKMSPFPEAKLGAGDIALSKRKFYTVELFCSCRMPYEKPKSEADLMAQCGGCKEWFHQRCEKIALEIFKASGINFFCSSCLKKM